LKQMTATASLAEDYTFEPAPEHLSPLLVAHEVLRQVRVPDAIFLQDVAYAAGAGSGVGTFLCPRSSQFPNPDVRELTGAQLIESVTQMAYCLTGLMIHGGVDLLGLDFEGFKEEIRAHRVHAVRTEIAFRRPCRFDRFFCIGAKLHRFRNGAFTVRKRNPLRYFVRIELEGTQQARDHEGTAATIFRARIAACHRLR
jgi:hypothetical protein